MSTDNISRILETINSIILGKEDVVKLALTCLLAKGHLLIEDLPGVGKTTLAHTLAATLGLGFQRIQFTSDMLPADILGVSVYERDQQHFVFHPGPIFNQLILADEVNRATPRTQSALLEAMEEQQVSMDGQTYPLTEPFFVIATQNPANQIGTFFLPESQQDRFLMCLEIGYPDASSERALLQGKERRELLKTLQAVVNIDELLQLQAQVEQVKVSAALIDYIQSILAFTRESGFYHFGLSPRAGLGLLHASQSAALVTGRDHVLPEDVQTVLPAVVRHRLNPREDQASANWIATLISQVAIP
ncbi:AAA family ATPase [Methylophaga sp. OBS4]|uniref:AAA family ATPase n=1 Tax=Methylophaga sp. OBS4 TaxID=2991935 RepID=UPI002251E375|nr:MoxR family ATPase [Methylophaga sp. OBS4]MCX4188188.1 MoxR family ATPase [Methylophaga sp. OBS4]